LRACCTKNGAIHERWLLSQISFLLRPQKIPVHLSRIFLQPLPYMHQSAHSTAFYSFLPRFDTCTVASHRHASSGLRLSSLHYNVLISIRTLYSLHLHIALVGRRCRLAHSRGSGKPYTLYISRSRELAVTSNHLSILSTFICSTVSFFSIYSNTDSSRALMCSFFLMRSNIPESSLGFGLGLLLLEAFRSLGPFGTLLVFFSVLF